MRKIDKIKCKTDLNPCNWRPVYIFAVKYLSIERGIKRRKKIMKMNRIKRWLFPLSMWVIWGITYGIALKSVAIGVSLGFVMALAFKAARDDEE